MRVAVLALQGAFIEHEAMLASLGVETLEIRQKRDLLASFDGLVIPGGESTVQGKLMRELGLFDPIREKIKAGLPVFGTCAGLILLADKILNDDRRYLATMDIEVVRNGYGRQSGSFNAQEEFAGIGRIPMFSRSSGAISWISGTTHCPIWITATRSIAKPPPRAVA